MDLDIKGLRALVTAGASGIGLATARAFGREGARVMFATSTPRPLPRSPPTIRILRRSSAMSPTPGPLRASSKPSDDTRRPGRARQQRRHCGPTARCEEISLADWQRTLAVNLTGQFLCAQRAIPMLKESRNASIANLSSAAGRFGFPLRAPYAASKWGVIGSPSLPSSSADSACASTRFARIGCGRAHRGVFAKRAAARGVTPEFAKDEALSRTSLRRLVSADDIAHMIVFLASPLGANISGHAMPVDADTHSIT